MFLIFSPHSVPPQGNLSLNVTMCLFTMVSSFFFLLWFWKITNQESPDEMKYKKKAKSKLVFLAKY